MTTPDDPVAGFFNKVSELLELFHKVKSHEGKLPPDINEQLAKLEQDVVLLKAINDLTFQKAGITEEQIKQALNASDDLPIKERHFLERTKKMKQEVEAIQRQLAIEAHQAKSQKKQVGKAGKSIQARKKKFRPMGGKDHWKPL